MQPLALHSRAAALDVTATAGLQGAAARAQRGAAAPQPQPQPRRLARAQRAPQPQRLSRRALPRRLPGALPCCGARRRAGGRGRAARRCQGPYQGPWQGGRPRRRARAAARRRRRAGGGRRGRPRRRRLRPRRRAGGRLAARGARRRPSLPLFCGTAVTLCAPPGRHRQQVVEPASAHAALPVRARCVGAMLRRARPMSQAPD